AAVAGRPGRDPARRARRGGGRVRPRHRPLDRPRGRDDQGAPVKADPNDQLLLLELQEIDTALAQLAHRRTHLPELAELTALERELSALHDELARVRADADDLDR